MGLTAAASGICAAGVMLGWIFFLIFGRTTVRRLSKNPDTKHALGTEFISGWRIFNVAEALVLPMSFFRRVRRGALSGLWADAALLRQHTGWGDRLLAHLMFWCFVPSVAGLFLVMLLDEIGLIS